MSALAREIGTRGRADAAVAVGPSPAAAAAADALPATGLKAELEGLRVGALCVRAARMGVDAAALDAARAVGGGQQRRGGRYQRQPHHPDTRQPPATYDENDLLASPAPVQSGKRRQSPRLHPPDEDGSDAPARKKRRA